ncbi:MAG: hypothetical protein IKN54_02115, partial [Lachnospiraceae bacterium]|nr:hypothetical protein [Lachnospiraceae bacterium]
IIAELEKNNADAYDKESRTFYAAKDLELCDYDAASQSFTKKDTVAQYTAFTVSRFSGEISCKKEMTINGVYITTEDGKEGWIQLPEEYDFNDLTEITEEEWKKAVPDFDGEYYPTFSNGILFPIYLAD